VWVTDKDNKVRLEHAMLEGKVFTWEKGADGLYPVQDINCRCTSTAVLDDIWKELGV
jgi:SPP1 gp7 family putative phage head morphogenesis protein